ncbi:hypothetical protein Lal_00047596 [Lupinus albus]|uniref:Putative transcription factor bHLH family n=1 Tax=Lupinus albus TaxID=3870 RepID=A0A6A5MVR4_LUPAL|nr:putative transcription factor bHLH family [Lupinus albus]KAF1878924.1 hypothetical protein Lal_00047596 [Lupinus albus]
MASSSSSKEPNIEHSTNSHTTLHHSNHTKITPNSPNLIPWKSQFHQQIYASNLVQALRRTPPSPAARQVRDTADRLLARTAKGTTRWSRAILASQRWNLHMNKLKKVKKASNGMMKTRVTGGNGKMKRRLPAVKEKARVLSRLVPGCKKLEFQKLLEETSDYISALEMQVRAMTDLTQLLAGRMVS